MDGCELRAWCLHQAGAVEDFPFGPEHSVFRVAGKVFALSALDRVPLGVSVKCEPDLAVGLRDTYAAIRPGYHLNKRHWNTITLDGSLPDELVRDLIEDSYDLVVSALPKRTRDQLGWAPATEPGASVAWPAELPDEPPDQTAWMASLPAGSRSAGPRLPGPARSSAALRLRRRANAEADANSSAETQETFA